MDVVRTQSGFHVPDGHPEVEAGHGGGQGRGSVTMDEQCIRAVLLQHGAHPHQHGCRDVKQVLAGPHQVEVDLGRDPEHLQGLVQHLPVLCRNAEPCIELVGVRLEGQVQGGHLDGLGAGSEHQEDLLSHFAVCRFGA